MTMVPEATRRTDILNQAHHFMKKWGKRKTKEVQTERNKAAQAVGRVRSVLGDKTPLTHVTSMLTNISQLSNKKPEVRAAAAGRLLEQAKQLKIAEHYARVPGDQRVAANIIAAVSGPIVDVGHGEGLTETLRGTAFGESAALIESARRDYDFKIKMLDHELESRSKTKKAFEKAFHDLDFELGMSLV
jgi:hypothetical protein